MGLEDGGRRLRSCESCKVQLDLCAGVQPTPLSPVLNLLGLVPGSWLIGTVPTAPSRNAVMSTMSPAEGFPSVPYMGTVTHTNGLMLPGCGRGMCSQGRFLSGEQHQQPINQPSVLGMVTTNFLSWGVVWESALQQLLLT